MAITPGCRRHYASYFRATLPPKLSCLLLRLIFRQDVLRQRQIADDGSPLPRRQPTASRQRRRHCSHAMPLF